MWTNCFVVIFGDASIGNSLFYIGNQVKKLWLSKQYAIVMGRQVSGEMKIFLVSLTVMLVDP